MRTFILIFCFFSFLRSAEAGQLSDLPSNVFDGAVRFGKSVAQFGLNVANAIDPRLGALCNSTTFYVVEKTYNITSPIVAWAYENPKKAVVIVGVSTAGFLYYTNTHNAAIAWGKTKGQSLLKWAEDTWRYYLIKPKEEVACAFYDLPCKWKKSAAQTGNNAPTPPPVVPPQERSNPAPKAGFFGGVFGSGTDQKSSQGDASQPTTSGSANQSALGNIFAVFASTPTEDQQKTPPPPTSGWFGAPSSPSNNPPPAPTERTLVGDATEVAQDLLKKADEYSPNPNGILAYLGLN